MTDSFRKGKRVKWNWGQGVGRGRVAERFERHVERTADRIYKSPWRPLCNSIVRGDRICDPSYDRLTLDQENETRRLIESLGAYAFFLLVQWRVIIDLDFVGDVGHTAEG